MATDNDKGMIDVKGRPFYVMTLNVTLANIPDGYQTIFHNVKFTFPHVAFCAHRAALYWMQQHSIQMEHRIAHL